jgi:erythromycin esterase-like protein
MDGVDRDAAARARTRYKCFDHGIIDPQRYGYEAAYGIRENCENSVTKQLVELMNHAQRLLTSDSKDNAQAAFYAEQNARVVRNAEAYYRAMFLSNSNSWNLRDKHMSETLERLCTQLRATHQGIGKVIVWAHNSHLGDARATDMRRRGQLNLGQLVRQKWGDRVKNLGFTTHTGTVIAANEWNAPWSVKNVRPSRSDSHERVLEDTGIPAFFLPFEGSGEMHAAFSAKRLERAIGVIYRPESEMMSHYFYANLYAQFDAVVHFSRTRALLPLDEREPSDIDTSDLETYPFAV